jgi:hypothetical protein
MGTYVHPMTENAAVLEKLAGVPAGTFDKLMAAKAAGVVVLKVLYEYIVVGYWTARDENGNCIEINGDYVSILGR